MSIGDDYETLAIDLLHRFSQAHESCGFIAPHADTLSEISKRNIDLDE
jgi:hypothetical protein